MLTDTSSPSPLAPSVPNQLIPGGGGWFHTHLPRQLTTFVGREHEITELKRLLTATPLLTLTGAGGSGKTRLALKLADELRPTFDHGVAWVSLAALADSTRIPQEVASALEVAEQPGRTLLATLIDYLRPARLLLVLDSCEHVVTACATFVHTLLRACPRLQVLATSREALGIAGERAWPVPPLAAAEAVDLFFERAVAVQPGFTLNQTNAAFVIHICQRLDGIPLAVELAAARVKVLTVEQIAARLDDVFRLLSAGSRTALPRHQTLRAAIDWSYDLLTEPERDTLRRLSVFVGGFTLEAAEYVVADDSSQSRITDHGSRLTPHTSRLTYHPSQFDVLDLLSRLVDKSLVMLQRQADEARYRLLETVRQYARDRLVETDTADETRQRHADYYLSVAETAEAGLRSASQGDWLNRLEAEKDNFRAVLRWARETGEASAALRLAGALGWFCYLRGHYREGREWLDGALTLGGGASQDRAKALTAAGVLAHLQCDYGRAIALLQEGLTLYRELGDARGIAMTLQTLGSVSREQARYEQAEAFHSESLGLWRGLGERGEIGRSLNYLGFVAWLQQKFDPAANASVEALSIFRTLGDKEGIAWSLINLGVVAYYHGDQPRAAASLDEALTLAREVGYQEGVAWTLNLLGLLAQRQNDATRAITTLRESLTIHWELGDRWRASSVLEALAGAAAALGQGDRAARLLGAAAGLRHTIDAPLPLAERAEVETALAATQALLGVPTFQQVYAEGQALPLDQAIALAFATPAVDDRRQTADDGRQTAAPDPTSSSIVHRPSSIVHRPSSISAELRILGFGRGEVFRDGRLLVNSDWTVAKARELLFFLLGSPPRTREQIGLVFWPEASASQLRASCRVTIYHLRRALGRPEWVQFEHEHYSFNHEAGTYSYDVEAFETLVKASQPTTPDLPSLEQAVALYRGDFLEDVSGADWVLTRREELRRLYVTARLSLGQGMFAAEQYAAAAEHYRQALKRQTVESAHRALMRCYARLGEVGQALRHYQTVVEQLREELKAVPAPETQALYERLRRGEAV